MENLKIYNAVRSVPAEAQKSITGGRMKGMTDINPMWRIKTLTEQFGPAGFGWYFEVKEKRLEQGANGEVAAFVDIDLYVKLNDEWSKPISGTGGNMFVSKETSGLYNSDECFKKATTDAIGVACKALGIGADVYWESDRTKYDGNNTEGGTAASTQSATKKAQFLPSYLKDEEWLSKACGWLRGIENEKKDGFRAYNVIENAFSGIQANEIQIIIKKYDEYKANNAGAAA